MSVQPFASELWATPPTPVLPLSVAAPALGLDGGRRIPFGWDALAVPLAESGDSLRLYWPSEGGPGHGLMFRFSVACDDREEKLIAVRSARGTAEFGVLDVRFADPHQCFELPLSPMAGNAALRDGIALSVVAGSSPLWIFGPRMAPPGKAPGMIRVAGGSATAFFTRLASPDSTQPFGWMEGCTLDALTEMAAAFPERSAHILAARSEHLRLYLKGDRLVYEDPRSRSADGRYYGIEATLPVATIARADPGHRAVDQAVEAWHMLADQDGCVRDAPTTAEGCYTVAYPMAVVARQRRSPELAALARTQLWTRRDRLATGDGGVHARRLPDGTPIFANWARAYAWFLLGFVRTAQALDGFAPVDDLWDEARRLALRVIGFQSGDGLWRCFVDDPATSADTSGSAGIAAALALGYEECQMDVSAFWSVAQAWPALVSRLTAGSLLSGGSQSNKGGERLQRDGYRVISGVGTGLMGQLGAVLARLTDARVPDTAGVVEDRTGS